jgi:radical SAM protein with 4Fe4S-binding SPASM domain
MKDFYCDKPWENILVEVNGDCYFCCFILRPSGRIGNLKKTTLEEAWTSRRANKIRKLIGQGKIPYCCQICPFFGEFKHEKLFFYKIYFHIRRFKDLLVDFWQGGFTRYRFNLRLKKLKKILGLS